MIQFLRGILSNIATLLLSLILAVIIWFNAIQGEDPLRTQFLQIPVDIIGRPDNTILISPNAPQSVQVVFQGPLSVVSNLLDQNFTATLDLSQVPFGEETLVPIRVQSDNPKITLLSQSPERLAVYLDQTISREIPVELDLRGSTAIGYTQGEPLIDPDTIIVSGTATQVEALEVARVTVFMSNERETLRRTPQPIFYNRQGRVASVTGLDLSTELVEVTIPINESAGFAEKIINVNLVGDPAPGYRVVGVEVDPPTILLQGRPTQLSAIPWVSTEPIDVTGLTESFRPQVALTLPEGVTLAEVEEIFVQVTIEPFRTTSIFNRAPQILGLGRDLSAELGTETVRIVLFGPLPVLNALLEEEVTAVIDLFGLGPGTYSLEPDVDFPVQRGIELRSVQPPQVVVRISRPLTTTTGLSETSSVLTTTLVTTTLPETPPAARHTGRFREETAVLLAAHPATGYYWEGTAVYQYRGPRPKQDEK